MAPNRASFSTRRTQRLMAGCLLIAVMLLAPIAAVQAKPTPASQQTNHKASASQSISLNQLANLLENDKTRKQLIKELRQAAPNGASSKKAGAAAKPQSHKTNLSHTASFPRQLAKLTAVWSTAVGAHAAGAWQTVVALAHSGRGQYGSGSFNTRVFFQALLIFVEIVVATIAAFFILRWLSGTVFGAVSRFAERGTTRRHPIMRRLTGISIGIAVDVIVVLLAGGAGYLAGIYAIGDYGSVSTRGSLFINAFVVIELVKVAIRAVFAARYDSLRLVNIEAEVAAWWSLRLRWFVGFIGYGLLVAVPIVNAQLSFLLGTVLTFLIMAAAYVYALKVIFSNRRLLTDRLMEKAANASLGFFAVLYRVFAQIWVLIALAYFTVLFIASQADPARALPFMLSATLQTLVAAGLGFLISGLLSRAIGGRIAFPGSVRDKLPMLEVRINSYVPTSLKVVRIVILLVVAAVVANAWSVFNFSAWLSSDAGSKIITVSAKVALLLVQGAVLWLIAAGVIEHRLSPNTGGGAPGARQQTLLILLRNTLAILIAAFTIMVILSQLGVNIGPLIAGAGVFGIAIGFGAQSLVKDIINGVFIQFENAINTGDVVTVGGVTGTAERLTIRSVSIRDIDGAYHIVPFSSAAVVTNFMREWAYFRTEYSIAFREDIDNAVYYLREAFEDLKSDPAVGPNILEDMTVPGVTALANSATSIRIMIKTKPGTQWGVGRAFNRLVKIHFDRAGIEIPFPHQTLYFGEDRDGTAPAAHLRLLEKDEDVADPAHRLKKRRRGDDVAPEETGDAPA